MKIIIAIYLLTGIVTCVLLTVLRLRQNPATSVRRAAMKFNRANARAGYYYEWMCPACGKVSRGIDHPYRFMSGLKFPACCTKFCWHGWRSFQDDNIPDNDFPMQPPEEFK